MPLVAEPAGTGLESEGGVTISRDRQLASHERRAERPCRAGPQEPREHVDEGHHGPEREHPATGPEPRREVARSVDGIELRIDQGVREVQTRSDQRREKRQDHRDCQAEQSRLHARSRRVRLTLPPPGQRGKGDPEYAVT